MVLVVASINSYQFNLAYALFIYKCFRNFFCKKGVFKTTLTKYQRENIILIFWSKSCKEETTHKVNHHFFQIIHSKYLISIIIIITHSFFPHIPSRVFFQNTLCWMSRRVRVRTDF